MTERRPNTITIASDDRARVPFAIIGVLLLVSSVAVVAVRQTQAPSTVEDSVSTAEAFQQTESVSRSAIQDSVKKALKKAANEPVTDPTDGPAGRAFEAGAPDESASPYEYDRYVFKQYTKLRVYLAVEENLASSGQQFDGTVRTTTALPDIDYSEDSIRAAIDRVELTAGSESDDNGVPVGEVKAVVEDVRVTVVNDGTRETDTRDVTVRVPSTTFALHERTVTYEKRLDMGFFHEDAEGMTGFGRQFAARAYPLVYGKAYYERLSPESRWNPEKGNEADFPSMIENYESEVLANDAVFGVQRNVFGTSDPGARKVMSGAWTCLAVRTGGKLVDLREKFKNSYVDLKPKDMCAVTQFVIADQSGEPKTLSDLLGMLQGNGPNVDPGEQIEEDAEVHIRDFSDPAYQWSIEGEYDWKAEGATWSGDDDPDKPPNSDEEEVSGDEDIETPESDFDDPVIANLIDRIYQVEVDSDVDTSTTGSEVPEIEDPSLPDAENWSVVSDETETTSSSIDATNENRLDGTADSSRQPLNTVTVTVEKEFERTKEWEYDGPEDHGPTRSKTATSSATYQVEVTTRARHSMSSNADDLGVSNMYSDGPNSAPGAPPRYFSDVPERSLTTIIKVEDASSVASELEEIDAESVDDTSELRSKVVSTRSVSYGPGDLFDDGEREEVRDWLLAEIEATNDRVNSTSDDWATITPTPIQMASDDEVFSELRDGLQDHENEIVYRNSRSGYDTITEKARAELRIEYVEKMYHWMDEVERMRKESRDNVNDGVSDDVEGETDNAIDAGLSFAKNHLGGEPPDLIGESEPGTIEGTSLYDDVTFRVESAPSYLSLNPVTQNTVPEVRPPGETASDAENTFHAPMAARNNAMLPNPGAPIVPWPSYWYVSVNNVNVRVNAEYARFTVSAHTGGPDSAGATTYVRQPQPVTLEFDGVHHRVGKVEAVNFESMTSVIIATPGGTVMPRGSLGAGDRIKRPGTPTKHELTECSASWPYVGPGFSVDDVSYEDCANMQEPQQQSAETEFALGVLDGDVDDTIEVALDELGPEAACELPEQPDDNKVRAAVTSTGAGVFADRNRVRIPPDDDEEDDDAGCPDQQLEVTYLDVGKGNAVLFEYQNEEGETETLLYDAGSATSTDYREDLAEDLVAGTDGERTIDHLVISHNHTDHLNMVRYLVNGDKYGHEYDIDIGNVYVSGVDADKQPERKFEEAIASETDASVEVVEGGDELSLGNAHIRVLRANEEDASGPDANSIVLTVDYATSTFLLTGDMRKPQEEELVESYDLSRVDVLVASHHGTSQTGSSETVVSHTLLSETRPKSVVISNANDPEAGPGHDERRVPNCAVLDRLEEHDVAVYWTAKHGDVPYLVTSSGRLIGPMEGPTDAESLKEFSEKDCSASSERRTPTPVSIPLTMQEPTAARETTSHEVATL